MLRGGFERPNDAEEEMYFQQQDVLQARNPIPIRDPRGFEGAYVTFRDG